MKKKLLHILFIFILGVAVSSCIDELFGGDVAESRVNMKLTISLPGAASAATRAATDTENGSDDENKISKIRLFVFQNDRLAEEVTETNIAADNKTITATTENPYKGSVEIVVMANHSGSTATVTPGMTRDAFYQLFVYDYGSTAWTLSDKQRIPMWGKLGMNIRSGTNTGVIYLYRAVSKMDVQVNEGKGLDNFQMKSIRVYYSQKQGYSAPLAANQPATAGGEVLTPSMIGEQNTKDFPLVYHFAEPAMSYHQIYVPEASNVTPVSGQKALCLVVGGIYQGDGLVGAGAESYYRIDLKDKNQTPFDVLRNYLYRLNIRSVSNPGTPTPEDALDHVVAGLEVSIEAWNETYLDGLSSQYSLTTSTSRLSFNKEGDSQDVTVTTDYATGWELFDQPSLPSWVTVTKEGNNKLIVKTAPNYGAGREAFFYVKAGSLRKLIVVEQGQPESANCYIVSSTDHTVHDLVVTIKGNGSQGLYAEDKDQSKKVLLDEAGATIAPTVAKVIWETNAGLIKITKSTPDPVTGAIQYQVGTVGTIGDVSGGNALIGGFDAAGKLLWSWHIWVCPEGVKDENWTLTGYNVMDRNLGAISNQPGVASLGLLYQWGRKDPFIGAKAIQITDNGVMDTKNYFPEHKWGVDQSSNNTIQYTIQHPTMLTQKGLSQTEAKGPYLWGTNGGLNKESVKELGVKTIYDPCPAGYRVPPVDAFVFKRTPLFESELRDDEDKKNDRYYSVRPLGWTKLTAPKDMEWGDGMSDFGAFFSSREDKSDMAYYYKRKLKKGEIVWYAMPMFTLEKTSENHNWNENLTYVPYNSSKWEALNHGIGTADYLTSYNHEYPTNGKYYGYHINYQTVVQPKIDMTQKDGDYYYQLDKNDLSTKNISWLPLSGAYDPIKGFTFNGVEIEQGSSLTVNSFIWTNSSIKSVDQIVRPAALFLHGAEVANDSKASNKANGRHIHGMTKDDIKAEPHYAGAVRCVKDEKKDFGDANKVPAEVRIGGTKGNETLIEGKAFVAVNDSWQVIDPGANWFYLTPDHGLADKNKGTTIRVITLVDNPGAARTATVKIKFSNGSIREMKVTQESKK